VVSFWDFELFSVYRIFIFQVNFVFVISYQSQVIFVHADGLLMYEKEVQILSLEFVPNLEIATPCNVVSGQLDPGSAGDMVERQLIKAATHRSGNSSKRQLIESSLGAPTHPMTQLIEKMATH
jgi:hypothetical protein